MYNISITFQARDVLNHLDRSDIRNRACITDHGKLSSKQGNCLYDIDESDDAKDIMGSLDEEKWGRVFFEGKWFCKDKDNVNLER